MIHCRGCGDTLAPRTRMCSECGGIRFEFERSCGQGTIVSWRTVLCADRPPLVALSVTLAIVELDEVPWLCGLTEGDVPDPAGGPVRVVFHCRVPGERYPVFRFLTVPVGGSRPVGIVWREWPPDCSVSLSWSESAALLGRAIAGVVSLDAKSSYRELRTIAQT